MSFVMSNGPPGVGKTRIVLDRIRQESVLREVIHEEIGVINTRNLVQKLWQYRDGGLLIADDANSLFVNKNKDMGTVIKTAFGLNPSVSYSAPGSVDSDANGLPIKPIRSKCLHRSSRRPT